MRENCSKYSSIKLFGKILPLFNDSDCPSIPEPEFKAVNKNFSAAQVTEITDKKDGSSDEEEDSQNHSTNECEDPETSTESIVKPKTPPVNEKSKTDKEENGEESNITEEKTLKKPDKILACPRCKSMDTKFCYYNNYKVHQPRHFCKACQRYWTAGGSMRNVPVGAGRRKTKNSAAHYHHLSIHKTNGRVLSFDLDEKKKTLNGTRDGKENGDDRSNSNDNKGRIFASPVPWISGVPWPYQFPPQFYPQIWSYGGWNMPVLSPHSSTNQKVSILGKHSRNGETVKPHEAEENKNGFVLVPKTLRFDDPDEAAKSSIWKTLGIKNEPVKGAKIFKTFQCKTEEKNRIPETSPMLMANPAALSRSMNFHESS